jgi:hypothetical protein
MSLRQKQQVELPFFVAGGQARPREQILSEVRMLYAMWKSGLLGGEIMPEDVHPQLAPDSNVLATYFTLGMSLNYQRNSYKLWEACTSAYQQVEDRWVFDVDAVSSRPESQLAEVLVRHRIALQPNRHPSIWRRNSDAIATIGGGTVEKLFVNCDFDLARIKEFIAAHSSKFPYLCGPKISNYWLFVMLQYMEWPLKNRKCLSVAPDTHVVSASVRLGIITETDADAVKAPLVVAKQWEEMLSGSEFEPIDVHTPLWLWSRAGFPALKQPK